MCRNARKWKIGLRQRRKRKNRRKRESERQN
jgi:hypothetical protein